MSKAVSSVARSVSSVVSGAVKAVTSVTKSVASGLGGIVKQITSSKIGKVAMLAAAIYFGGAALSGGFGAPAGSGLSGFLQGAGAGVSNAASSLSTAWGQAVSGNLSQAGSSLSSGFQGQAANSAIANAPLTQTQMLNAQNAGIPGATDLTNQAAKGAITNPSNAGLQLTQQTAGGGMGVGEGIMGAAKIQAGSALIGGAMQGKALQDQRQFELDQAAAARERYNANAGAKIFADNASPTAATTGAAPTAQYDAMAEAQRISAQRKAEFDARNNPQTGLVARGMQYAQPVTNNNFPVYNPAYYRG